MARRLSENRKTARHWLRRRAMVVLNASKQPIKCTIFDLSDGGARVGIERVSAAIPQYFTLVLFEDRSVQRDCEVVWRDGRSVGVKFTSEWYGAIRCGLEPKAAGQSRAQSEPTTANSAS